VKLKDDRDKSGEREVEKKPNIRALLREEDADDARSCETGKKRGPNDLSLYPTFRGTVAKKTKRKD